MLGLRIPVVATPRVLEDCLLDGEDPGYEASVKLRLRLMSRLIDALLTCPGRRTPVTFQLDVQFKADPVPRWFALKAVRGPGDGGQPYLTVMMPDEE
ncbi:MAG: hypothetical protein K2X82_30960 [Gemmataceae bacterium]|nr:hypothetical protein [Gemmataceae bacterium]